MIIVATATLNFVSVYAPFYFVGVHTSSSIRVLALHTDNFDFGVFSSSSSSSLLYIFVWLLFNVYVQRLNMFVYECCTDIWASECSQFVYDSTVDNNILTLLVAVVVVLLNVSNDIGIRWKRNRFKWMRRCKHK